jgi:hypothetical protein
MFALRSQLLVVRSALFLLCMLALVANVQAQDQDRPIGRSKAGQIAGSLVPGSETLSITVIPATQTFVDAWVEYNVDTCEEISAGAWTVNTAPKNGTTATGTVTGTLANGDCPGVTFTFAAIYYTWTSTDEKVDTDHFKATWKAPDFTEHDSVDISECGRPTIMFYDANIAGKTTNVSVGQEIMLSGQAPNAACVAATASQQWSAPSSSNAVGGYTATTNPPNGATTPLPTDTTSTSYGPFYWTTTDTYSITYQYTLTNGQASPIATAKFKVDGPKQTAVLICGGNVSTSTGCTSNGDLGKPAITSAGLQFGGTSTNVGIEWTASAMAPSGSFTWVQLITGDVITETPSGGGAVQTCYPPEVPTPGVFPGLDTAYPYPIVNASGTTANDNPSVGLPSGYDKVSRAFSATMNLMWTPTAASECTGDACTIPVPLGYLNWKFNGAAKLVSGTWKASGAGSKNSFVASTSYPTWTSWVSYQGSLVCH